MSLEDYPGTDLMRAQRVYWLKAPGFLWLCSALLSVVLFPVWTSGRVICPICYQEFIPHRKKYGNNSVLRSHPSSAALYQRCIMFTAAIVPPCYKVISISHMFCHFYVFEWHLCAGVFLIMESNCHAHTFTSKLTQEERRVHVEVLSFLSAIRSNLWTLCACLKHSIHPWLWYQTPGSVFVKMQPPHTILPFWWLIFFSSSFLLLKPYLVFCEPSWGPDNRFQYEATKLHNWLK